MNNRPESRRFFIFGLPRSRTAWVANLLSYGEYNLCHHELFSSLENFQNFKADTEDLPDRYSVGNSGSDNLIFSSEIFSEFPDAKFVYLRRSEKAVIRSMERCQPELADTIPQLRELANYAETQVGLRDGLVIDVDNWDQHDTWELWHHCLPGIDFPHERNYQLEWMKVEITNKRWDHLKERAKEMYA